MSETEGFFAKRYGNNIEKLHEILNNFTKAEDEGGIYRIQDIDVNKEFLDLFSNAQELRSKFYFYLNSRTAPVLNDYDLKNIEKPSDIYNHEKSKTTLVSKLIKAMLVTLKAPSDEPSDVKDFVINLFNIAEEYMSLVQPYEIKYSETIYKQKELSDEIDKVTSYLIEVKEIKKEVDETLKEITKKMKTQTIDALTMTTILFSAFTFLAVNAGIISGISQITVIDIPQMILMYLVGNFTVLLGITIILYLLKRTFDRK